MKHKSNQPHLTKYALTEPGVICAIVSELGKPLGLISIYRNQSRKVEALALK